MKQGEKKPGGLVRVVSRYEIVGLAFNDVIGSGIYLLPAAAAALMGVFSVGAVLLAGLAVALLVLCFAEAASYFDEPGGGYLYTREAFGDFVGFEVGWMTWLARVASVATLLAGFAQALGFLWPEAADMEGWQRPLAITALLAVLTWINVAGVKLGARTSVAFTVAKVIPLLLFLGIGLFALDFSGMGRVAIPDARSAGEAALLLLFAYAGFENTAAPAGEYRNPKRNVPFALLVMITGVTLLYTGVQLVAVGTLPGLEASRFPLADAASLFMGSWGGMLMSLGAIVSIGGNVGNTVLIGPRYLFALARDGYGPALLGKVHSRYRTPAAAIVTQSLFALVLALTGSFVGLALLSIIARLATYMGTAAALPILRKRFADRPGALRLPGGAAIPAAALVLCLVFLASTTPANLAAGLAALATGAVIYRFRRTRSNKSRSLEA